MTCDVNLCSTSLDHAQLPLILGQQQQQQQLRNLAPHYSINHSIDNNLFLGINDDRNHSNNNNNGDSLASDDDEEEDGSFDDDGYAMLNTVEQLKLFYEYTKINIISYSDVDERKTIEMIQNATDSNNEWHMHTRKEGLTWAVRINDLIRRKGQKVMRIYPIFWDWLVSQQNVFLIC
ncbi:hypothetical protein HELRODRAFT_167915 [Helobdella robusta]|uniref:Uncharacterized protein n=1 Tax=Helobdella robusta TaxID=6412 RepID=T1EZY3_HELRO|nr:hypothetical protein HELRODRAFT_167915 [Helobdella robusta]ESO10067.1 hypothetical protein HELRODRAFT_167915 [Helobdella robusta]